jgi:colanic acid/amylovoran biosynthesis glycosyltransferase
MKIFVIQPNLTSASETWLYRINTILGEKICGFAAHIIKDSFFNDLPVFNLNGRLPNLKERILAKLNLRSYDVQKTMRHELFKAIRNSKADVLLVHYATTANYLWDVVSKFSGPIFIYVHGFDVIWDHYDDLGQKIHAEDYTNRIRKIAGDLKVNFIANSEISYKNLSGIGISQAKLFYKPYGVKVPEISRNYLKKEMTILYLGRMTDFKGPDLVLKSFIKACDMGFEGKLIMAGEGYLKLECEEIAQRSNHAAKIIFLGAVTPEEASDLYLNADIYSMHNCFGKLSHGYEMFGVTIIEAMSYGLPVVTGAYGGSVEIIKNEVDGLLIEPGNIDAHAASFLRLQNNRDLCRILGANARKKVAQKYSTSVEKASLFQILGINEN